MGIRVDENMVKAIHEDISKVIALKANVSADEIGSLYIQCGQSWDMVINVIYVVKTRGVPISEAIGLYKQFLVEQLKKRKAQREQNRFGL